MTTLKSSRLGRAQAALTPALMVDRHSTTPIYRQLYEGFRMAILDGRLRPGQRIPSTRSLALELRLSRMPVVCAYEQLRIEGYLETRVGAGTCITKVLVEEKPVLSRLPSRLQRAGSGKGRRTGSYTLSRRAQTLLRLGESLPSLPRQGAFRLNLPSVEQFPSAVWGKLVSRHARAMTGTLMGYGDAMGHLPLREAIADYLATVRAVRCAASQIAITTGSQQALQLIAQLLLNEGDPICVEEPGYPGARLAFTAAGASVSSVPLDDDGLSLDKLERVSPRARAVYITPSHQYPMGMVMSASRRMRLLSWAATSGAWIIEDDYDSEYRFEAHPIGALQGMDADSRVIYVGTFSKVMFPALRLGYVVMPQELTRGFAAVLDASGIFASPLYQTILTDFILQGHLAQHIRRMRVLYAERRKTLVTALRTHLGADLEIVGAEAGMHVVALLPPGIDDTEVSRRAAGRGIAVLPLSSCYAGRAPRGGLVLGYGGATLPQLREGVRRLKVSLHR